MLLGCEFFLKMLRKDRRSCSDLLASSSFLGWFKVVNSFKRKFDVVCLFY